MPTSTARRAIIAAVATAATVAVLAPLAAFAGAGGGEPAETAASGESSVVSKTFSGSNAVVGLTNEGNIMRFDAPVGTDHMNNDGYLVCYDATQAYEYGFLASGFGSPTVSFPSGTKMRVVRTTLDGKVRLQQDFAFSNASKKMTIKHTLTNLSASTLTNVIVRRNANFDANGTPFDTWARTAGSVFAWDNAGTGGLVLQHVAASSGVTMASKVIPFGNTDCSPAGLATPLSNDEAGTLQYGVGNLAPGKVKTMTVAISTL